jgi:hypothetical protein
MSKQFSAVSTDVSDRVNRIRAAHHAYLGSIEINLMFVFTDDAEQVLKHQGYPAAATCKIVGLQERAAGLGDAMIVFDRFVWADLTSKQKDALVDHELTHLLPDIHEDSGTPKYDSLGRMKLKMRQHDHQIGWFSEIAERFGADSPEQRCVEALLEECQQLSLELVLMDKAA